MGDLDELIEWIMVREEDEELVAWLRLIDSFDEPYNPPITMH